MFCKVSHGYKLCVAGGAACLLVLAQLSAEGKMKFRPWHKFRVNSQNVNLLL